MHGAAAVSGTATFGIGTLIVETILLVVDIGMTGWSRTVQIDELNERFKTCYRTWSNAQWYEWGEQAIGDWINSAVDVLDLAHNVKNWIPHIISKLVGGPGCWNDFYSTDNMSRQYRSSAVSFFGAENFQKSYGRRAVFSATSRKTQNNEQYY